MSSEKKDLTNSSSDDQIYSDSSDIKQKESKNEKKNYLDRSSHIQHDTQSKKIISFNLLNEIKICAKIQTVNEQSSQELEKSYKCQLLKEDKGIYIRNEVQKKNVGDKAYHQVNNFSNPQVLYVNEFINDQIYRPQNFMTNQAHFNQQNRDYFHHQQIYNQFSSSEESQYQRSISGSDVQTQEDISKFDQGSSHNKYFEQQK